MIISATERLNKAKTKMTLNTLVCIEETKLRLKLSKGDEEDDSLFRLQMLICWRPNASLRQISNQCKINFRQATG